MPKYIVVGSRKSEIVKRFIRYASAAKLNLQYLYPREITQSLSASSSPDDTRINNNLQPKDSRLESQTSAPGNQIIGTRGVIWAVDEDSPATEYFRTKPSRDEVGELKDLFKSMREKNVKEFLWFTKSLRTEPRGGTAEKKYHGSLNEMEGPRAEQERMAAFIKGQEGIDWTILSNGMQGRHVTDHNEQTSGEIIIRSKERDESERVARALAEILKVGGLKGTILDMKTLPTKANKIPKAISHIKQSRIFLELTAPSRPRRYSNLATSKSSSTSVDSVLVSINPRNSLKTVQSRESTSPSRMTQLLAEVRAARERGENQAYQKLLQLENSRRTRATTRYQDMKDGVAETDNRLLRQGVHMRRKPVGLARTAIHLYGASGIPEIPSPPICPVSEPQSEPVTSKIAETRDTKPDEPAVIQDEEQSVLDKLVDVLSNRSADVLSPHLAMPISTNTSEGKDGYHPRWQYTRWHSKKGSRRH